MYSVHPNCRNISAEHNPCMCSFCSVAFKVGTDDNRWLIINRLSPLTSRHEDICFSIFKRDIDRWPFVQWWFRIVSLDHYLLMRLMPDSQKGNGVCFQNKTRVICWLKDLQHIHKSRWILCRSSWVMLCFFFISKCDRCEKGRHFLLGFLKNLCKWREKSFNFFSLCTRTIHTVMSKPGSRVSVTLKNTQVYFCSTT